MGNVVSNIANWNYERRIRRRHMREQTLNPSMQSVRMLKGTIVLATLYFLHLKRANAEREVEVAKAYHSLYLEGQDLKDLVRKLEEAEKIERLEKELAAEMGRPPR